MKPRQLLLAVLGLSTGALLAAAAQARDLVIHAGTLIDGVSATPRRQVSIVIRDDQIVGVESGFVTPAGAEVVDLSKSTVMPGFIDCHVHISAKLPSRANATEDWLTHSELDRGFEAAAFLRAMLQQGFTSARDVGGGDETAAVRNAIDRGRIPGPRLWVSLEPLGPTAGHGDPRSGLDPKLSHPGWDNGRVDSPDEARLRVREHKRRGADLIKIMPSGGIASTGDDPRAQLMTDEEMRREMRRTSSAPRIGSARFSRAGWPTSSPRKAIRSRTPVRWSGSVSCSREARCTARAVRRRRFDDSAEDARLGGERRGKVEGSPSTNSSRCLRRYRADLSFQGERQ